MLCRFGVREHGMGAIVNGLALHKSGLLPYCATFYIFTDYMRAAMRMSALSEVRSWFKQGACACQSTPASQTVTWQAGTT